MISHNPIWLPGFTSHPTNRYRDTGLGYDPSPMTRPVSLRSPCNLFRIVTLVLFVALFWVFHGQKKTTTLFENINSTLTDAIQHAWRVNLDKSSTDSSGSGALAVLNVQSLQDDLACLLEYGCKRQDMSDMASHESYTSSLCTHLASKRVLLLGSSLTYTLHTHLLSHVSRLSPDSPPHTCLGPDFCTFHHICLPLSNLTTSDPHQISKKSERRIKPPSARDLVLTQSTLMHYVQSFSLYPGLDKDDGRYRLPVVDPATEVRVKEMYWLGPARRADVIVLNRGPLPAPAWTYDGTRTGNWTFVDSLPDQGDLRKLGLRSGIVNAALTATITKFLPEVLDTLRVMRSDAGIKLKPIIWHGSPYQSRLRRDRCDHSADEMLTMRIEDYLTATGIEHEPWVLYYNAQVYMQGFILRSILPHWGVVFLPLDAGFRAKMTRKRNINDWKQRLDRGQKWSCDDYDKEVVGELFLGGLGFVLDKLLNF